MRYLFLLLAAALFEISGEAQVNSSTRNPPPKLIQFTPVSFSNLFSLNVPPVLHIQSGDTVSTETIDATGRDKNGTKRQRGGNPLTGPFYIDGSEAGDVLAVTLTKVALNRPYAYTSESFVSRSMPDSISAQYKKTSHLVKWKLDIENKWGWIDSSFTPYPHLKEFKVALKPFLGCIGVAPNNRKNEILSFFQGNFGGNLDYSAIAESVTIYLPVLHDGGFFYIGDGHAVQGDGEIAGNALETSLDVDFSVKLIKHGTLSLSYPRAEDSTYIMSIGSAKSLEDAMKIATAGLLSWLQADYRLSVAEGTQVMSTSIEYTIAEVADPEVVVVAKIKKSILSGIKP